MNRVIIAGSREVKNSILILNDIKFYLDTMLKRVDDSKIEIIQGGAEGVDALAKTHALMNNMLCTEFKADWETHGKKAGPVRNSEMAEYASKGDTTMYNPLLLAFPSRNGKGTQDMIKKALSHGIDIVVNFID